MMGKTLIGFLFVLGLPQLGLAAKSPALKNIHVSKSGEIQVIFDGKLDEKNVVTEYFNDVIQFSIKNVSVYPAKIMSVDSGPVTKVFAYQYSPETVRLRLTIKGKADDYKEKVKVAPTRTKLDISVPTVVTHSEVPKSADESELLKKVVSAKSPEGLAENGSNVEAPSLAAPLASGKPLPSMGWALAKLAFVLILILGASLLIKKFAISHPKFKMKLGKNTKLIEVVATHYLEPKKSLSVVKIGGRTLVLGVSDDSIHLITQLEGDHLERSSQGFEEVLDSESDILPESTSSFRSRIRSRLEGLKPL